MEQAQNQEAKNVDKNNDLDRKISKQIYKTLLFFVLKHK